MDKLKMMSKDKTQENFEILQKLFPNAVTETIVDGEVVRAVDKDVLQQEINATVVEGRDERYQFTWPDKKRAIISANAPINKTLRPCREESVEFDNTENLYIEGDNLEVLKLLQETYLGKIKMIYIDPPYNTGHDFVYNDKYSVSPDEWDEMSGELDEYGNRLVLNNDGNGRFHTDWLNMMYPRLKLAKDLLSEDGSIFVSIDYNETENLKKMMDEIFGASNFQREIIWRIGWLSGYKTTAPNFIRNHDTIFFYSRNSTKLEFVKKYIENCNFKPVIKKDSKTTAKLSELGIDEDKQIELFRFFNHENRPERYPIEDTWNSNEYDDLNSIAIVSFSGEKVSKMLNFSQDFKGQKSVKMLMRIIEATTKDDDIIMDFFSGTASTAHAVIRQNFQDVFDGKKGKRKFIMVQLPEKTDEKSEAYKAGYKNICEIGKERIRRAGELEKKNVYATAGSSLKWNDERKAELGDDYFSPSNVDIGFRVLKLDSSNMKDVYYNPADFQKSLLDTTIDNIKEDRTPEDLLFQIMLELGVLLSEKIEESEIAGKKVFNVANGYLIACFDSDVNEEVITAVAKQHPIYFVMRDSSISSDTTATNFDQIFETYSPDTVRKVI